MVAEFNSLGLVLLDRGTGFGSVEIWLPGLYGVRSGWGIAGFITLASQCQAHSSLTKIRSHDAGKQSL